MADLMEHQVSGVDFLRRTPRALLGDDPGLGKTATALTAAVEPILVVCPAMIRDGGVWDDEVAKWRPDCDLTQTSYHSLVKRVKGKTQPELRAEFDREWGTVILDEHQMVKNRQVTWTKAVRSLRSERTVLLSGTPLPNAAVEAFVPLQLLFPEEAVPGGRFGSYWRWAGEYFDVGPSAYATHAVGEFRKDRTWDGFREQWGDRYLRRLREDCLDLPPLTEQWMACPMAKEQKRVYKDLKKSFVSWLDDQTEVVAWNQAAQLVKLCKIATGLEALDPEQRSSGKLDVLRGLLSMRDRPTLVVGHFRNSMAACARVAASEGKSVVAVDGSTSRADRLRAVRAFQSGSLDVLCATIGVISEGLTLTAADQVVFVERSWTPSRNAQCLRRIHRIGQTRPVSAVHLVTPDTVDERILEVLQTKTDEVVRAIRPRDLRSLV